jgi:uncharacterized protein YecA (UPF0149 family)
MVGRNEKCSCGSGLKYKKCCLFKQIEQDNDKLLNPPVKTQEELLEHAIEAEKKMKRIAPKAAWATILGILAASNNKKALF